MWKVCVKENFNITKSIIECLFLAKAALIVDYRRFKQLQPVCSNLAVIYDAFAVARDEKVPNQS
jgi:hypothetical protein